MSVSSLKELCMNLLVNQIKNLPPQLMDEVIGNTKKSIKKDVIQEIGEHAFNVVNDMTGIILNAGKLEEILTDQSIRYQM